MTTFILAGFLRKAYNDVSNNNIYRHFVTRFAGRKKSNDATKCVGETGTFKYLSYKVQSRFLEPPGETYEDWFEKSWKGIGIVAG